VARAGDAPALKLLSVFNWLDLLVRRIVKRAVQRLIVVDAHFA
jgi:hypothetical protein